MRQIDTFFSPSASQTLYHYTGVGGLLGMVESRSIWASHVYYLNDSREILHATEVLGRLIEARYEASFGEEREFLGQFRTWLDTFRINPYHLFVFSLSEQSSLLSQWRSYTPHGKGVSVGISAATLNHVLSKPGFRIAKCLYGNEEHRDLLESLLEKLLTTFHQGNAIAELTRAHPSQSYHPFLESFRADMLQVLAIVKHPAYREEQEWRVISPYFPKYTVAEVRFREGASMLLPFTELQLPATGVLFDQVILGPSQDDNLSMSALSAFLSNRGVCNSTIDSRIPFRKWTAA